MCNLSITILLLLACVARAPRCPLGRRKGELHVRKLLLETIRQFRFVWNGSQSEEDAPLWLPLDRIKIAGLELLAVDQMKILLVAEEPWPISLTLAVSRGLDSPTSPPSAWASAGGA